mmetsp:Transcript_8762/g.6503  ORF Transcript_8762/g.6503 Transcript_8762/m.6503 type:complete len:154 (+) Transcript_8762:292-753(+)
MARLMEDLEDQEDEGVQIDRQGGTTGKGILKKKEVEERDEFDSDEEDDEELEREGNQGEGYVSDPELMTAQRHYDFGSNDPVRKRNRSAKARGRTSPSGKSMDEKNLRSVKLTTQDYIEQGKEQKRKGKYGVTVPKPFKFDMRDQAKPKGIRQ